MASVTRRLRSSAARRWKRAGISSEKSSSRRSGIFHRAVGGRRVSKRGRMGQAQPGLWLAAYQPPPPPPPPPPPEPPPPPNPEPPEEEGWAEIIDEVMAEESDETALAMLLEELDQSVPEYQSGEYVPLVTPWTALRARSPSKRCDHR